MAYNPLAESYSKSAAVAWFPGNGCSVPPGWSRFDQVYSDIADCTPLRAPFRKAPLVGSCPTIAHLAPKTQVEILAVVVRDMLALPADADGLRRVSCGVYEWRLGT